MGILRESDMKTDDLFNLTDYQKARCWDQIALMTKFVDTLADGDTEQKVAKMINKAMHETVGLVKLLFREPVAKE
jgi:hypothetical protein